MCVVFLGGFQGGVNELLAANAGSDVIFAALDRWPLYKG